MFCVLESDYFGRRCLNFSKLRKWAPCKQGIMEQMSVAVIGGGAAGFFAAISCKTHHPNAKVTLYEKTGKFLAKVKVSGGGRCNVTNACTGNTQFARNYPRGERFIKNAFRIFDAEDTIDWFESRKVALIAEEDKRIFPKTNDSQTIIDCLLQEADRLGIVMETHSPVDGIEKIAGKFRLSIKGKTPVAADKVMITTGGSPKPESLLWLERLGHTIVPPVPSLFTFNMPQEPIRALMGVVIDPVTVKVQSTKLISEGPLLITHWGMSGPAILKLSAWGARELHQRNYQFKVQINWLGSLKENELREKFSDMFTDIKKRKTGNRNPLRLPARLWNYVLEKVNINPELTWAELSKKSLNKLVNTLLNDEYEVSGKTTFKEEFVTCGGVTLNDIKKNTMESKPCPGLYFAGEVLDIDGITGGFNFQAAWTTGFIAGRLE